MRASSAGLRKVVLVTSVPSVMRAVVSASAVIMLQHSHCPPFTPAHSAGSSMPTARKSA